MLWLFLCGKIRDPSTALGMTKTVGQAVDGGRTFVGGRLPPLRGIAVNQFVGAGDPTARKISEWIKRTMEPGARNQEPRLIT